MLTINKAKDYIRLIVIYTDIGSLYVLDLDWTRILMAREIRQQITFKKDRFSGTSFIISKYELSLGGLYEII